MVFRIGTCLRELGLCARQLMASPRDPMDDDFRPLQETFQRFEDLFKPHLPHIRQMIENIQIRPDEKSYQRKMDWPSGTATLVVDRRYGFNFRPDDFDDREDSTLILSVSGIWHPKRRKISGITCQIGVWKNEVGCSESGSRRFSKDFPADQLNETTVEGIVTSLCGTLQPHVDTRRKGSRVADRRVLHCYEWR